MNTHAMPPAASVPRKNKASVCSGMASSGFDRFVGHLGRVERGSEPFFLAVVAGAVPEFRPADSGGAVTANQITLGVFADDFVNEQVLGDDDVTLHADHL